MLNSAKIAELQGKIASLETALSAAEGKATTLEAQLNQAKTDLATAQAEAEKVTGLNAEITQLKADLTAANERATQAVADLTAAKADFDTKVEAEVTNRLAAAGVDPIKRDPQAKGGQDDQGGQVAGLKGLAKARAALEAKQQSSKK